MPLDNLAGHPNCSFCGLKRAAVDDMIKGPDGLYICSACIDLCVELLAISSRKKARGDQLGKSQNFVAPDIPDFLKRKTGSESMESHTEK